MTRERELLLPPIVLDRKAGSPLHQQIRQQLAQAIRIGAASGARLPSTRGLARLLRVSRNTVLAAYDELAADGLIRARRGAGMVVTGGDRGWGALDPRRLLSEGQYPARTVGLVDQDGTPLYLND